MNFKTPNKLTVGLTGGLLCGKSTALRAFGAAGAFTLSCDALVREISARACVRKEMNRLFGTAEKKLLAAKVFSDVKARRKLEKLLHPLTAQEISDRLRKNDAFLRVVEVPLLFEAGWQDAFDLTVCVCAPTKTLPARLKARKMKKTDFLKRASTQLDMQEKAFRADICLLNNASERELKTKVRRICRALVRVYTVK